MGDGMSATDGEIRAAARGIYEEYDNLGAGYTTAWGNLPGPRTTHIFAIGRCGLRCR
jgi:hypothetical protein